MRDTLLLRPLYADSFRCIGPACEDHCCCDWRVGVDKSVLDKYQALPEGPFRILLDRSIVKLPDPIGLQGSRYDAAIELLPSGDCPLLREDHLCSIHAELGEDYLPHTCAVYPRAIHTIDGIREQPLMLSCPEAARLVLLAPWLSISAADGHKFTWDDRPNPGQPLRSYFWVIRGFTIRLLIDRRYPLWQRLFLLGVFTRRLDGLVRGEVDRTFPEILDDFTAALQAGSLGDSMALIAPDLSMQLTMVLSLVEHHLQQLPIRSARLKETIQAFVQGISHGGDLPFPSLVANYEAAYGEVYEPFFRKHAQILENYLVNQVFRTMFPFGEDLDRPDRTPRIARCYAKLVTQFALIKAMLIGVAGHYGSAFRSKHVVQTVQTVTRHFEHAPRFLCDALDMLHARKMDDARGLTMLLRN